MASRTDPMNLERHERMAILHMERLHIDAGIAGCKPCMLFDGQADIRASDPANPRPAVMLGEIECCALRAKDSGGMASKMRCRRMASYRGIVFPAAARQQILGGPHICGFGCAEQCRASKKDSA